MVEETNHEDNYIEPVVGEVEFIGKDVLEIGCGAGEFTIEHLKEAGSILAIDIDQDGLDDLQEYWELQGYAAKLETKKAYIEKLQLKRETYDVVVFSSSL